jgi:hypothetical protein
LPPVDTGDDEEGETDMAEAAAAEDAAEVAPESVTETESPKEEAAEQTA